MRSGDRLALVLFGAAVLAALVAVGWLVLGTGPAPDRPPVTPPPLVDGPTPPVSVESGQPRVPRRTDRRDPAARTEYAVAGQVRRSDNSPAAGAEVLVYPPAREEGPPEEGSGGKEPPPVDPEILRDMFDLEPDELSTITRYTGVPSLPDEKEVPVPLARGTAAPDGTFRIVTRGKGPFRIEAWLAGAGRAVAAEVPADETPVLLRLGSAVALTGRVLDVSGSAPVPGATVVVRAGPVVRGTTTGADGRFSISGIHPGTYTVTAGAPGLAPTTVPEVEASAEARPVDILIGRGHAVRITVMKFETPPPGWRRSGGSALPPGPPLEGATVVLYRYRSGACVAGVTGAGGTLLLEGLGEGRWQVGAVAPGHNVGRGREVRITATSPPEESREVRLDAQVETPVRVMDEGGAPVRGARVYTGGLDEGFDARYSRLVGTTDDEGVVKYTFDEGVPRKAVLWIVPEGNGAAMMVEPEDSSSGKEEKVVIRPGRVIQGTVRDGNGRPVEGAMVYVNVYDDERDIDIELYVYTDARGAYRFPSVPFGETSLEVDTEIDFATEDLESGNTENPLVRDFEVETEE